MRRDEAENMVLTSMVEGKRARGRHEDNYMEGVRITIRENIISTRLLQMIRDRDGWRSIVAEVRQDVTPR